MRRNWQVYWNSPAGPREVLKLALPLVLSTCSLTLQVFIDRLFLTWYSEAAIAASIPAVLVMWVVLGLVWGIVTFGNTFVAQYHGAGRDERIGPVVGQAVLIALAGGLAMLVLVPLAPLIFNLVGHAAAVRELEIVYFRTLIVSAAPMLVMTAASNFFGGLGRTWVVCLINLVPSVVNVVLDYAMIFGHWGLPELGIAGAGWATAIAYLAGAAFALGLMWAADDRGQYGVRRVELTDGRVQRPVAASMWRPDAELMRRLLRYGGPNGLMLLVDVSAFTWFELLVGRISTEALAATNVVFNINTMAILPLLGLGTATQILVGQRLGEERPELAARATWSAFGLALVYTVVFALSFVGAPQAYVAMLGSNAVGAEAPDWHGTVVVLLRFVAIYMVLDMAGLIFSSALRGAGDTRFVMGAVLGVATVVLIVPSYVGIELLGAGLTTAWCFLTCYVMVLGGMFFARFQEGAWRSMRVIEPDVAVTADVACSTSS